MMNLVLRMLAVAVIFLAGCGGGSGSSVATVNGTASEGALITGKIVKLKDANGRSAADTTTDPNGNYSIDVTGLTAPFLVTVHGNHGYYLSVAPSAGRANINPITTTVVALAAGAADLSALFDSYSPALLTAINSSYSAKCVLLSASLQVVLPDGLSVSEFFTGTITAGNGMDGLFDSYLITVDSVAGITVKTNDAAGMTLLSIPVATIAANLNQSLPTVTSPTAPVVWIQKSGVNVWTVYGKGLDRIGGIYVRVGYETSLKNPVIISGSVIAGALSSSSIATPGIALFAAVSPSPFAQTSGDIVSIAFGSGVGKVTGITVQSATAHDSNPEVVPVTPYIFDPDFPLINSSSTATASPEVTPVSSTSLSSGTPSAGTSYPVASPVPTSEGYVSGTE